MANAYDYNADNQPVGQQPTTTPPNIFGPLGAPLGVLAALVRPQQPAQPGGPPEGDIDPYTGAPVYTGPLDVPPGSTPPAGYVNASGRLKPVPKGYDWSVPQSLSPTNARWPRVGPVDQTPQQPQPSPAPQPPPPPPAEPYISSRNDRPHAQWGEPDFAWRGAMKYPGVSPGPFMPQKADFPGLLHNIVMGLGRFGSHYSGMPAIAMGTYATAYWNAYSAGLKTRAAQSWQQYQHAREVTKDRLQEELRASRDAYALYAENPTKLAAALSQIAARYGDQPLKNALANGDLGMVERLLQARDSKFNDLGKLGLQTEKAKAEIERIKAQTDLARARERALEKGGQVIPPDYEDPDQIDGEETQPPAGDRTDDDEERAPVNGDLTGGEGADQDGATPGDNSTLGQAAARGQGAPAKGPAATAAAPTTTGQAPATRPPAGIAAPVTPGQAPAARPPAGAAPAATGQPGAGGVPRAPGARAGAPQGAPSGVAVPSPPGAPDATGGIGAPGAIPPSPTGAPGAGQFAPPRGVPLGLPPPHFVPPGMTVSQLDFEAQRYYEGGKDLYPAKQIAENTAIHRRASQINTFVNRLIDHYRPGVDSEQQLIDNIGRAEPNLAGALRDILAGGEPLPRAGSGASEYNRLISQLPARIRPGFSGQIYAARQKIANDYSPGGYMGRMVFAENRLAPAALEVVRTALALPEDQFKFERQIDAFLKGQLGDPEYSNFFVAWRAYVSELVRIQRGGTGAESDIQEQIKNIAPSSSLRQIIGGLRTDAKITIPAMDDAKRYWDSMNMGYDMPLYDQKAHDTLDMIMNRLDPEKIYTDSHGNRAFYVGNSSDPKTDLDRSHWLP